MTEWAHIPSATLYEAAPRAVMLPIEIGRLSGGPSIAGRAFTVACAPGDNLWLHRALDAAQPGDVLVVGTSGGHQFGYFGELMTTAALAAGIAGLVLDGCVRDIERIRTLGFTCFARGTCIRGTTKHGGDVGGLQGPLRWAGALVETGDLIVGDDDGVVAVAAADVDTGLRLARARAQSETVVRSAIQAGRRLSDLLGLAHG